jgi:hypothetical protein
MALDIVTVRATVGTGDSSKDFTSSGFGTPKAALFFTGRATTDATAGAGMSFSVGAADGTNQACVSTGDGDALSTTDCGRWAETDQVFQWADRHYLEGECDFNSWITDGVRVDVGNAPAANRLVNCVLFAGSDITDQKVGNFTCSGSQNGTVDVDVGFTPDLVIFFGSAITFDTSGTSARITVGFAVNESGEPQVCHGFFSKHDEGTSDINQWFATNRIGTVPQTGYERDHELTAFISNGTDGFTITTRTSSNGGTYGYLALKFSGSVSKAVGNFTTPTSTGNDSVTGVGFQPDTVFLLGSTAASTGSSISGGTIGVSVFDGTDDYSYYSSSEDAVGTTNTQSLSDDQALHIPDNDGADEIKATYASMNADGFALNYSDVLGTGRYVGYLALGAAVGSSTAPGVGGASANALVEAALALEQEGFRWRNDDGSESAATWRQNQDVQDNIQSGGKARVRFVVNATGDPTSKQFQIESIP